MEEDVQALKGVNSHILNIFLNEGLVKIGEAETIKERFPEYRNNSNRQGQWTLPFLLSTPLVSAMYGRILSLKILQISQCLIIFFVAQILARNL